MAKSKFISIPSECLLLALAIVSFLSCTNVNRENIQKYYFPIQSLKEGKIYEYRSMVNDSLAPEYWFYQSVESDSGTFLMGQLIYPDGSVRQYLGEEVVANGILLRDCLLVLPDSLGELQKVPVEILSPNVFLFEPKDSLEVLLYKIKYRDPEFQNRVTTLIRNRRYKGKTTFDLNGKEVDCVVFRVSEVVDTEEEGHLELELEGREVYGEGIGLLYYIKSIKGRVIGEYVLTGRYSLDEWKKE